MRIRKHAQRSQTCCLPSQLPSPNPCQSGSPSTRVCELNRSPWDVMSFTPEAMIEDGVSGDESIPSSKGTWEEEDDSKLKLEAKEISWSPSSPTVADSVSGRERRNEEMKSKSKWRKEGSFICCNKTDGKGWKCRKEAKRGHSLCEHHLAQLKSYYTNNKSSNRSIFLYGRGGKSGGAPATAANNVHRGNMSSSKKSSSNYYYYTGFGPLWGKGRGEDKKTDMEVDSGPSSSTPSLSSLGDADDEDDDDEVEDDDDDDCKFDKKRARKPVKTRSLKSLL